ncbi:flavodoxin domain-containing protein [Amycolatopsis rhabdoformis]|uniref:Flavodoxin domain-containing protein n=1 Tax=Amycolatopsis rhabdoformis TaxID=1448059 RepID=A0ABZ1ICK9_9PSEU|nr:flavodoxin domain-containing protein [Amycolatopsis rhabdoformis]WSE32190.1 flavodoxin domain-containing protein [Amycolatopsis rhabdoformis]
MRTLIVYESMFGSTEELARAVADGLGSADVVPVERAPHDLTGYDLLVVGAPTHVHGLSRPATREAAADQAPAGTRTHELGAREWLGTLNVLPPGLDTAVFDTRLAKARWLTGSAAHAAAKLLRRLGHEPAVPPASFFVEVSGGDTRLVEGEPARAAAWGADLAAVRQARTGRS